MVDAVNAGDGSRVPVGAGLVLLPGTTVQVISVPWVPTDCSAVADPRAGAMVCCAGDISTFLQFRSASRISNASDVVRCFQYSALTA